MFKITKKEKIADKIHMLSIQCPEIARKISPGQFIMVRVDETSERAHFDYHGGTKKDINIVFEENPSTKALVNMKKGNTLFEVVGPLGTPSKLGPFTNLCLVGEGAGIASIYNLAASIKSKNNRIIAILGASSKKSLFWEDKLDKVVDYMFISTQDGSKGRSGGVDVALKDLLKKRLDIIYVAAKNNVMEVISNMTRQYVKTIARVNTEMLDGTGMCGVCRLTYDGEVKLACIDGPDFDAHKVNWDSVTKRENTYENKAVIYSH